MRSVVALRRCLLSLIAVCWVLVPLVPTWAQSVSPVVLRRAGLEQAWITQTGVDRTRAEVQSLTLHVNRTALFKIFDVQHDGGILYFSANQLDAEGNPIGPQEAERLAEKAMIRLQALGQNPQLTVRELPLVTLYVQTSNGTLEAINAETGRSLWTVKIGNPRYLNMPPAASDRYVVTINGSDLYVLDAQNGQTVWQQPVVGVPVQAPAIGDVLTFVPMLHGRIEAYWLDDPARAPWIYNSGGEITNRPTVSGNLVSWPTARGFLYVARADEPEMRFRLDAGSAIEASASSLPPDQLFVASMDGYVYAIEQQRGGLLWQFSTGHSIRQTPVALGECVYPITEAGEMFCLNSQTGQENWVTRGVHTFLAAGQERLYGVDQTGQLRVLDQPTGGLLASIPVGKQGIFLTNTSTDRLYFISRSGTLVCLRETGARWPTIHVPLAPPEPSPAPAGGEPPAPDQPAPPAGTPVAPPPVEPPPANIFDLDEGEMFAPPADVAPDDQQAPPEDEQPMEFENPFDTEAEEDPFDF